MLIPEDSQQTHNPWPPLEPDCDLYCSAKNNEAIDKVSGQFLRGAFLRKGPKPNGEIRDKNGVSVTLADGRTYDETMNEIIGAWNPQGIGILQVSRVRAVEPPGSLTAIQDRSKHANITGLPAYGEDVAKAERLATILAKATTVKYVKGHPLLKPPR